MARAESSERFFVAGLMVSLLAHVTVWVVASGFVRMEPRTKHEIERQARVAKLEEQRQERVRLGIDDGQITSLAWLGFKEETPNQGIKAMTDQSAMTPAPGTPGAAPVAEPPKLKPTPPAPPVTSAQLREAAQALSGMGSRIAEAVKAMASAAPQRPEVAPESNGGGGKAGDLGLASDKESIATSIESAPSVRLGQVAAANGLDIQTKHPKWSVTTMQTQRPRNPTIRITFGRDGKVLRAEFVSTELYVYNTGSKEVDEPLMTAVYSWTARGKRLEELTSRDPNGEVTIIIRVLLAG